MDSIGEGKFTPLLDYPRSHAHTAAFDYQFGALASQENELMKAYFGLM